MTLAPKKRPPKKSAAPPDFLDGPFALPQLEERVLKFWDKRGIFEKSLAENAPKKNSSNAPSSKNTFVFYEGPPYANGKPAIHHILARVVKDVMLRYKTMRGYYVPRRAGWDTHGLPVEMAAEKALGLKSKRDIEKYGVKLFNEKAKEQVWIHKDEWERLTRRIGYWLDLKNAYVTYAPEYIETIWWTLAQISKRTLLYKGHKVVPWCTRCGTSLSSHELAQGYKEVVDNSVYVKFRLRRGQRFGSFVADDATYVLSWTTTPWTLPGNLGLAVGEDIPYVLVRTTSPKESFIVAKNLAAKVFEDKDCAVMGEFPGRRLVGLDYEPLFDVPALQGEKSYKVHFAEFVTTTDGTGVVHTAVMYGEDDYALGKKIGLPEYHTVDEEGKFTREVAGFAGDYVKAKETEEKLFEYLRKKNYLFGIKAYAHEYPHCWRCDTPILYYARVSWFIAMSTLRAELLRRNKSIHWMPAHVRDGRFGEWLREAKDWNLSRERYWGAPLPIWECAECGHTEVVESLDELSRLAGGAKNRYWVMRHGEAEGNVLGLLDSGPKKFHLTSKGKKEVECSVAQLKKSLAGRHERIDLIFSSDVTRAKETAEIAEGVLGIKKTAFDVRLREIRVGREYEGRSANIYDAHFSTYEDHFEKKLSGGESLRDVRARAWKFFKECEAKHKGKNILIVSHGDPIWVLEQAAGGITEQELIARRVREPRSYMNTGEVKELAARVVPRNGDGEVDLHRPFTDTIFLHCPKCAAKMVRVPEVADVWYDSGAMPLAQAHFPFAPGSSAPARRAAGAVALNQPPPGLQPQNRIAYPADYIAEGMDQTRGWFYTMLAIATALGYEAPYKNVITFGLLNDRFGKKMSKSKGNVVDPWAVIEKYGTDAVRWYFFSGTPFGEPKNFDENEVGKALRRMHLIVYNSFMFWKTYGAANVPPRTTSGKSAPRRAAVRSLNVLDQWILARLDELTDDVTRKLDACEIREAALSIESFVDDLSRWYIRRSRRRLQRPESKMDYEAATTTLGRVLLSLVKLLAPFTPFFAESLYGPLGGEKESVHLDEWPAAKNQLRKKSGVGAARNRVATRHAVRHAVRHGVAAAGNDAKKLITDMAAVRELAAAGLAKRAEAGIKVRQPLGALMIRSKSLKLSEGILRTLAEEVNVKTIRIDPTIKDAVELDVVITPALREEGVVRDVARMVQELRQKAGLQPKDKIVIAIDAAAEVNDAISKNEAAFKSDVGARSIEYKKPVGFTAEASMPLEGKEIQLGIRKA